MKTFDLKQKGYFTPADIGPKTKSFYEENGYLVLTGGVSEAEIEQLKKEAVALCRGDRGDFTGTGRTTDGLKRPTISNEFKDISDDEVISKFLCIHNSHKASDVVLNFLKHPNAVRVLTNVIGPNVKCMQSMFFIKAAGKPGQAWHQDEDYIPTRDRSLCGAWIALDDAFIENGCLWVIPGSHKPGVLWPQYPHKDERFDCTYESYNFPYKDSDSVPVEVPKGSIVFFNGYLLHRSLPNKLEKGFRRSLVNHYMSAESLLPWRHNPDVGTAKNDFRDIVMVAGIDPYAWKGVEKRHSPHVRPAGEGGCGDGRVTLDEYVKKPLAERAYV